MIPVIQTPWGPAQSRRSITPDLTLVTTASHGGLHVSSRAWARIRAALPTFVPFAGEQWLEEDCDFHVAVALWPAAFDSATRNATWRFACSGSPTGTDTAAVLANWMATTPAGREFFLACEAWAKGQVDRWEQGGGCSSPRNRGWWVSQWRNVATAETREVETPRIPASQFATTTELDALARALDACTPRPIPTGRQLGLFAPAGGTSNDD